MCEQCGKPFEVSKRSRQRFCSVKCQNEWQTGNTGEKNPKFGGGYVICEQCGKSFLVGKYVYESTRHHFCSSACRKQWYASTWSQSPGWKIESRNRAARLLASNDSVTQTRPQVAVNKMLEEIGIEYKNEVRISYYSIDNYIENGKLAIEVMGDYWHCSPLRYNQPMNNIQRNSIRRDKAKHTDLTRNHGIRILYLWEGDVMKRRDLCVELIKHFVHNNGVIENYNSFNYFLNDCGELEITDEVILPYQEIKSCALCPNHSDTSNYRKESVETVIPEMVT